MDRNTKLAVASLSVVSAYCVYRTFSLTKGINELVDAVEILTELNDHLLTAHRFGNIVDGLDED